jgi:MFS family permease
MSPLTPLNSTPQPAPETATPKLWNRGTLTYTTGALAVLFFWLLWGDFAWNMKERAIGPVGSVMLKQFKASDFAVGLLMASIPSAIGLLLSPIIAVKSDRHRGRFGRRIPFLLLPTPMIALSMVGLAYTVPLSDWLHLTLGENGPSLMACRIAVFSLFWSLFEIFQTIAQTVFGALCNDTVPQAVIGRFFGLFRAVSLLVAIIFNLFILEHAETQFQPILIGLSIVFAVGFSLMCFFVKEGDYPPPAPIPPSVGFVQTSIKPVQLYLKECYSNPYYLWVFGAIMLGGMAGVPINVYSLFYAKSLGIELKDYAHLLVLSFSGSLILTFFIGWLADKFHPLRVGMTGIGLYAVVMLWGSFYAVDAQSFSIAFVIHGVLTGTYLTGTASLSARIFPKVKYAQFGSAAGIVGSVAYMSLAPSIGLWLDATGNNYRHTFIFGSIIAVFAVFAYLGLYRRFLKLGGHTSYVAPV